MTSARLHLRIETPGQASLDRRFDLDEVVVGRSTQVDVVVADNAVSRRHARLFRRGDDWLIEDLGSVNGTLVNGARVAEPKVLQPGDVVGVGPGRLVVKAVGARATSSVLAAPSADIDDWPATTLRPATDVLHGAVTGADATSRLRLLNDVHRALAAPISLGDLLELVLDRAFTSVQPEDAAIFLRRDDGELYRAAERHATRASGDLLISRSLARAVTEEGAAAIVNDVQADARFAHAESIVRSGVRSIAAAPLSDVDGCLGMIALYSRAPGRTFADDDLELLVALAAAAALRIRNIALVEEATERRLLGRELALANEIQKSRLTRPPELPDIDVAARMRPARTVGGDLYDFLVVGRHLWFVVGDVAGKGIGAALLMAVVQTLFRAAAPVCSSVEDLLARLNSELCRDNERAVFVTALAGCLDLDTGTTRIANAGHLRPYRVGQSGLSEVAPERSAVPLGLVDDVIYPVMTLNLGAGDGLVIYTDGVCDAIDGQGRAFGSDRLEPCLQALSQAPAREIVDELFEQVDRFAAAVAQEDDITVVALRYRGHAIDG